MNRAAALLAVLLLTGCSGGGDPAPEDGPVPVPVPTVTSAAVLAACSELSRTLPETIGAGLTRRPVTGDPIRTYAWGDPAVTLECGGEPAGTSGPDGEQFGLGTLEGQCMSFLRRDTGDGNVFATYQRLTTVRVVVPDAYDSQVVQDLVAALDRALPEEPAVIAARAAGDMSIGCQRFTEVQ